MAENVSTSLAIVYEQKRFTPSLAVPVLVDRLRQLRPDELVTYNDLATLCHENIQGARSHLLRRARDICLEEHNIVLTVEAGIGVRRIPDDRVPQFSNKLHHKRFKNDTARYRAKIQAIDPTQLSDQAKSQYVLAVANLGLREAIVSKPFQKEIEKKAMQNPVQSIDKEQTLNALRSMKW